MARLFLTLFVLLSLLCSEPQSEILEFDLAGLTGTSIDTARIDSFVYEGKKATAHSISVRITGGVDDLGKLWCAVPPGVPNDTTDWYLACDGSMRLIGDPETNRWYRNTTLYELGPFDQTGRYFTNGGFTTLFDGDIVEMRLLFATDDSWEHAPGVCDLLEEPNGQLFSVTVILDVTYAIPAEPTTWGRIKSLY